MYRYYGLYLAWLWLNEPKHVAECLIVDIDYQHTLCLNELTYIIAKHNGMAPIKLNKHELNSQDGYYKNCSPLVCDTV
jgi:hypothetical protein